jgi:hypothetical protein
MFLKIKYSTSQVWTHDRCQQADRRVARFFLTQYTKTGKNIPKYHNITKWPLSIKDGLKIFSMTTIYIGILHSKALQNLPKLGFLVWKYTIWQHWLTAEQTVACRGPIQFQQRLSPPNPRLSKLTSDLVARKMKLFEKKTFDWVVGV